MRAGCAGRRGPPRSSRAAAATRAAAPRARARRSPALTVSSRWSVSARARGRVVAASISSSASATRRRSTAPPSPSAARRSRTPRATVCCAGVEPREGVLGQARDRAAHAAGVARRRRAAGAARRAAATARAARWRAAAARRARRSTSATSASVSSGSTRSPARSRRALDRAPELVAAASAPTSTWLAAEQARQRRVRGAAAVVVRAQREDDDRRRAPRAARARDERRALVLVAADGERLLELVDGEHAGGRRATSAASSRSGCSPGRMTTCPSRSLPGSTPLGQRRQQPRAHDGRLAAAGRPDDAQQRRADQPGTSSATSRSRPKKYGASATSNAASPLNGQIT